MFFKKIKKKDIFGKNIEPDCKICRYSFLSENGLTCSYGAEAEKACRSFSYDPIKRVPDSSPDLGNYSKDDYTL